MSRDIATFGGDLLRDTVQQNQEFQERFLRKSITRADSTGREPYSMGTGIGPYGAYSRGIGQSEFPEQEKLILVLDPGIEFDDLAYSHPEYATCILAVKKTLGFFQTIKFQLYRLAVFMKTCVLSRSEEAHYKALTQVIRSLYNKKNRRIVPKNQADELMQRVRNVWVIEQQAELRKIELQYAKSFEKFLGKKPSVAKEEPSTEEVVWHDPPKKEFAFVFSHTDLEDLEVPEYRYPLVISAGSLAPLEYLDPSEKAFLAEEAFLIERVRPRASSAPAVLLSPEQSTIPPAPPAPPPLGVPVPPPAPSLTASSKRKKASPRKNLESKIEGLKQKVKDLNTQITNALVKNRRLSMSAEIVEGKTSTEELYRQLEETRSRLKQLEEELAATKEEGEKFSVIVEAPPEQKQPSAEALLKQQLSMGGQSARSALLGEIQKIKKEGFYLRKVEAPKPAAPPPGPLANTPRQFINAIEKAYEEALSDVEDDDWD